MNTIDFTQTGGFPFDQGTLAFLQESILLSSKGASWGGQLAILSGCDIAGSNAGNGFVSIGGEVLPFVGGLISANVIVIETVTELLYEDNVSRPVQVVRYATFGDDGSETPHLWVNFKRNTSEGVLARLERLERIAAPHLVAGKGGMILWNRPANQIPDGWAEVVNWRGRLPMGYDPEQTEFNEVGKVGGSKERTLSLSNMPPHTHSMVVRGSANYNSGPEFGGGYDGGNNPFRNPTVNTSSAGGSGGSASSFSILNPYRVVVFIEYTGN